MTSTSEYVEARDRASGQGGGRPGGVAIAVGLALGPAAALGLARFAYALLLPSMRTNLGWSFSAAGAMSTANAVGYLAGALLGAAAARRAGARRSFLAGLTVTVLALAATAASGNLAVLLGLRVVAGAAGAVSYRRRRASRPGQRQGGSAGRRCCSASTSVGGAGIVASGLIVIRCCRASPRAAPASAPAGCCSPAWPLGATGSVPAEKRAPEEPPPTRPGVRPGGRPAARLRRRSRLPSAPAMSPYVTFIVAFLKSEGAGRGEVGLFWVVPRALPSSQQPAWGWGRCSPSCARRGPAAVMAVLNCRRTAPLLLWRSTPTAFPSGSAVLAVVP